MRLIEYLKTKIRGDIDIDKLKKNGCIIGLNFHAQEGSIIDPGHCWLITIGNNVTFAPRVHVLAHDASTKNSLGHTKIGNVIIGNDVFIGASTIVLPNVTIADKTIIGAGSVVTHNLTSGVYIGNPCTKIAEYEEWVNRQKQQMKTAPRFDENWKIGSISKSMKEEMKELLTGKIGFIV
jgi:maltose O-acetyltransferase